MLEEKKQILVVDDEPNLRRVLAAQLARDGYEVLVAEDGEEGLATLADHHIDLVITDLRMPKVDGMELLRSALELEPELPIVMMTAHGTVDNAVEALKTGAFDYITKPFDQAEVRAVVSKALRTRALSQSHASLSAGRVGASAASAHEPGAPPAPHGIIGQSAAIRALREVLDRIADAPTTVLIRGESGTGKELVARALFRASSRADKPFIKVNCAAIPQGAVESELFGYEQGAFAGAVSSKPGRLELASGGTLFLDEVGSVPIEIQVKLLRALQEGEFERVGGVKTLHADVRLIAATHGDLRRQIQEGTFREDFYYRLNVVPLVLPPLRERVEDIAPLCQHFIAKSNQRLRKQVTGLDPVAEQALLEYPWPGNIRELENVIERAVLFCDGPRIGLSDLPPELIHASARGASEVREPESASNDGLKEQVKAATVQIERSLISKALEQTGGNVTHTARLLKISRKGLQLKMKELGLREREDFREA
ncbi:MAG: sigma-54-dependent Fis family transcriptional regulator [Polyangiaceae bacterium]|nr:sigma-54-dependent Fis family transcriptional regulator [Polyangiaceae bacterium]MCW5789064.1 sigma-54-dependent Fis family transcriptional regulator [Polyangiaceae bacterium]